MINDNLADLADDEFTEEMEIEQDRLSEIDDAPRAPDELEQRVRENHSASPADSGATRRTRALGVIPSSPANRRKSALARLAM